MEVDDSQKQSESIQSQKSEQIQVPVVAPPVKPIPKRIEYSFPFVKPTKK